MSRIDPLSQEVFKFLPNNPPARGETILVDGVRHRVTRCKIKWAKDQEPDGRRRWTILSLRAKELSG